MRPASIFVFSIFVILPFASTLGDSVKCPQIACASGLTLDAPENYRWLPGDYRFEMQIDGTPAQCKGKLPLKNCGLPSIVCTAARVNVSESGCALAPVSHGWGPIYFDSNPKELQITVFRNDHIIGEFKKKIKYQSNTPLDPKCGAVCLQANERLNLK